MMWLLARPAILGLGALSLVLLLAVGVQTMRVSTAHGKLASLQTQMAQREAEWNKALAESAAALAKIQQEYRDEEQRRVAEVSRISIEAESSLRAARVDADAARVSANRLREQYAASLSSLRRIAAAPGDTPSSAAGATAADLDRVLADVFGRIDQVAGIYAGIADASRIAGLACEQAYDSLTLNRGK